MLRCDNAWKYRIIASLIKAGIIELDIWMDRIRPRDLTTEDLYALLNTLFPTLQMIMDDGVRVPAEFMASLTYFMDYENNEREAL